MFRTRRLAAGFALAISLTASSAMVASAALAVPAGPSGAASPAGPAGPASTGPYSSWKAAQRAAGFSLKHPTKTYTLKRSGDILVEKCEVTGELSKRDVFARYGSVRHQLLSIDQNNSGGPCGNFGEAKTLRTYRVEGVKATLYGFCDLPALPSCNSRKAQLLLTWLKHGVYYEASSRGEWRAVLVSFARSLHLAG